MCNSCPLLKGPVNAGLGHALPGTSQAGTREIFHLNGPADNNSNTESVLQVESNIFPVAVSYETGEIAVFLKWYQIHMLFAHVGLLYPCSLVSGGQVTFNK